MNRIHITRDIYVTSDLHQWMIARKKENVRKDKKTGERHRRTEYEPFKFYSTLDACVKGLGMYLLRTGDARSAAELIESARAISNLLSQNFTAQIEVKPK